MDSSRLINNDHRNRVEKRVTSGLARLDAKNPVSNHLDEILAPGDYGVEPIRCGIAAFQEAADTLGLSEDCSLILCWPCGTTPTIELSCPTRLSECGDEEPPSLILLHSQAGMLHEEVEEYRKPVDASAFGISTDNVVGYYRSFRNAEAIEHNWEFSRALYFQLTHPSYMS